MSFPRTWYTVDEVESKFGVPREVIMLWVENGTVRSEVDGAVMFVNVDDVELKVEEMVEEKTLH